MSAHTGETEVETIETPTPPKIEHNRREDDIIEEDPEHSGDDDSEESDEEETEPESEENYRYTYETDSDDPFSGDIECCLRIVYKYLEITF